MERKTKDKNWNNSTLIAIVIKYVFSCHCFCTRQNPMKPVEVSDSW